MQHLVEKKVSRVETSTCSLSISFLLQFFFYPKTQSGRIRIMNQVKAAHLIHLHKQVESSLLSDTKY